MRYRKPRCFAASVIVTFLVAAQSGSAQDCPECATSLSTSSQGVYASISDGSCQTCNEGAGACGDWGSSTGTDQYDCFQPLPCGVKADYGYRPFTEASQPDLFYNFYVPNNFGAAAAAYPAPYPTPNLIGHVYYTYQPLMPHEMLYTHARTYHQYYNGGMGLNRTTVRWYRTPVRTALKDIGGSVGWFLGNIHR